jgi:3',5'-nucleoside bisphosphate phosphatase
MTEVGKFRVNGKADFHTHTICSDGSLSPEDLVKKAKSVGIDILSITDHDTICGIDEAMKASQEYGVEIVAGVELSATHHSLEIHILGYFFDPENKALLDSLKVFREKRFKRAERIVAKLNRMNIPLTIESVLDNASGGAVGRPHIATALVTEGHTESYRQAFDKYLGEGRPAYEKKDEYPVAKTVQLIAQAGGLSFLAHPGRSIDDTTLFQILKTGIDGIEVIHPSHTPELIRYYRGILCEYDLLETGGSDFHGGMKEDDRQFGAVSIPVMTVEAMQRRLFSF